MLTHHNSVTRHSTPRYGNIQTLRSTTLVISGQRDKNKKNPGYTFMQPKKNSTKSERTHVGWHGLEWAGMGWHGMA